jgi:autotransporter-associated beta strand protein
LSCIGAAVFISAAFVASPASAQVTWNGGGSDALFSTGNNWAGGFAPFQGSAAGGNAFVFTGASQLSPLVSSATVGATGSGVTAANSTWFASSITFDSNAGAFTIGSNASHDGNTGSTSVDLLSMTPESSIIQQSSSNQDISDTVMLPTPTTGSYAHTYITGAGSGSLTLNSVGFQTGSVLVAEQNLTLGNFIVTSGSGIVTVAPGVTLTLSGTGGATNGNLGAGGYFSFNTDNTGATGFSGAGAAPTIQASSASGFTSSSPVVTDSVTFGGSKAMTFSGGLTVTGATSKTLTFNDSNTSLANSSGVVLGGTIQIGATDGVSSRTTVISVGTSDSVLFSGTVSGSASTGVSSIDKTGNGTLYLPVGANGLTIDGGTVVASANNITGGGGLVINSGTFNLGSNIGSQYVTTLSGGSNAGIYGAGTDWTLVMSPTTSGTTTYAGSISGPMVIKMAGVAGAGLILSGSSTFGSTDTGIILTNANTLTLESSHASGVGPIAVNAGCTLFLTNNITVSSTCAFSPSSSAAALVNLSGSNTISHISDVYMSGPYQYTNMVVDAGSTLVFPNAFPEYGSQPTSFILASGSGTFVFGGNNASWGNSFTIGDGTHQGPTVDVGSNDALGIQGVTFQANSASTLQSWNTNSYTLDGPLTLKAATTTFGAPGTGNLTFTGTTTLGINTTLTINNSNTTLSGLVTGSKNLSKNGTGTLTLSGTDNSTGTTTILAGTVLVSGSLSGSTTVGDSANLGTASVLAGSGSMGAVSVGTSASTANTGALLEPGYGTGGSSILDVGTLNIYGGAHLGIQISGTAPGTGYDQVVASGRVQLIGGPDLQLTLSTGTVTPGLYFLLLNNSGSAVAGTFSSLNGTATPLGQDAQFSINGQEFQISYTANLTSGLLDGATGSDDIALQAFSVPEPAVTSLFGSALFGISVLALRRRRKLS